MSQRKTLLVVGLFSIFFMSISAFAEESLNECLEAKKVDVAQCEKNVLLRGVALSNSLDQLQIISHRNCKDCEKSLSELEQQFEELMPDLSQMASSDYSPADPEASANAINMMVGLNGQINEIKKTLRTNNATAYDKYAKAK